MEELDALAKMLADKKKRLECLKGLRNLIKKECNDEGSELNGLIKTCKKEVATAKRAFREEYEVIREIVEDVGAAGGWDWWKE